jgi:hypothetical protein
MSTPTTTHRSTGIIVGGSIACVLGLAGIVTGLLLAFGSSAGAHPAPAPSPSHSSTAPVDPINPAHPVKPITPIAPITPITPPVTPPTHLSPAQIDTLQQQLGQLNYYDGPINGVMTPQTVQAIEYLQRDSQLPQNGEFNQVTYLALQRMLATGNNQMGN